MLPATESDIWLAYSPCALSFSVLHPVVLLTDCKSGSCSLSCVHVPCVTMASLALIVTFTLSLAQVAFSFNCSIPPIYVDIHKRAVHDSEIYQYGLFVGLGTGSPKQNFSMWPSLTHNETTFAATDFCTSESPASCPNNTHGTFQSDLSPT